MLNARIDPVGVQHDPLHGAGDALDGFRLVFGPGDQGTAGGREGGGRLLDRVRHLPDAPDEGSQVRDHPGDGVAEAIGRALGGDVPAQVAFAHQARDRPDLAEVGEGVLEGAGEAAHLVAA
ncbi:hypothetical protein D3C86_1868370 [compost metagenome]